MSDSVSTIPKILLFGAQGMLGNQFFHDHFEKFEIIPLSRFNVDVQNAEEIEAAIVQHSPDFVLNTAAFTVVDKCEEGYMEKTVFEVNTKAPEVMAKICEQKKIPFLHISTDYVFSGEKGKFFAEDDEKNPINVYGHSKSEGEDAAIHYNQTRIVRTAWLSGEFGHNFVSQMVHFAKNTPEIFVVQNEWGNPSFCADVSAVLAEMIENIEKFPKGIYHAVSEGNCSRMEFVEKICSFLELSPILTPVENDYFDRLAKRPECSVLQNTKLPKLPHWEKALENFLTGEKEKLDAKRALEAKKRRRNMPKVV